VVAQEGTMSKLMMEKLQEYMGHHVSFLVESGEVFTGRLKMFDEQVLVFDDIVDSRGDKGKELLINLSNILWIILED
jgi:small nuclear ribonucleoprotein (snRNP)-like protein